MSKCRIPKNLRYMNARKRHITGLFRGHDIDCNLSLIVLGTALELQGGCLQALLKVRKGKKKEVRVLPYIR